MQIAEKPKFAWKEPMSKSKTIKEYVFNRRWAVFCGFVVAVAFFVGFSDSQFADIINVVMYAGLLVCAFTIQRILYAISSRKIILYDKYIKIIKGMDTQKIHLDRIDIIKSHPESGMFSIHLKLFAPENIYINSITGPSQQEVVQWFNGHGIPVITGSKLGS